jgi:hypothetical protein
MASRRAYRNAVRGFRAKEPEMKYRVALTVFLLLAGPAFLVAQSSPSLTDNGVAQDSVTVTLLDGKTTKTMTVAIPAHPFCPVAMQAKQGSGAGMVMVRKAEPDSESKTPRQSFRPAGRIHLILNRMPGGPLDVEQVAGATVTARGLSARGRIDTTPAVVGSPVPDLHRTQNVTFNRESDGTLYADLDLPGFTAVFSIRIDSLALKDGSTWTLDTKQGCVVTPDPLMLVAGN